MIAFFLLQCKLFNQHCTAVDLKSYCRIFHNAHVLLFVEILYQPFHLFFQIEVEDDDVLAVGDTLQITFSFNDGGQGEIRYFVSRIL